MTPTILDRLRLALAAYRGHTVLQGIHVHAGNVTARRTIHMGDGAFITGCRVHPTEEDGTRFAGRGGTVSDCVFPAFNKEGLE